jgi:sugar lactone lactonase YvrE
MHTARPATRALASLALALAAAGCATTKPQKAEELVWPFPPEKPRIRYVRSFSSEDDLRTGAFHGIARALVPADPTLRIQQPTGLALSPDERWLYVACAPRGRVLAVDLRDGEFRFAADVEGQRPVHPFGIALDAAGSLYVSDSVAAVVWVYGPDGKFLRQVGKGVLERPTGIALDRTRQVLYVVEGGGQANRHHAIEVFSLGGEKLRTIGTRGSDPGQFNFPANAAVAPGGNLHVADMLNFRVQAFDPEGNLVAFFGQVGTPGPGAFQKLKGLAFDAFGNLHAVDSESGLVQMFNPRHQPLMAYAGRANRVGFTLVPGAIVIDSANRIFVADYAADAVHQYELFGTTAEEALGD